MDILLAQEATIKKRLGKVSAGTKAYEELTDALDLIQQKIENFRVATEAAGEAADQREYERTKDHAAKISTIWNSIAEMERATQMDRLRILEGSSTNKAMVWKREAELLIEQEQAESARRLRELENQREYIEKWEKSEERKAEAIRAINAQIEAEENRSTQRRNNILEDYYKKQNDRLKSIVDKAMGILTNAVNKYKEEGWKGFFKSLGESFRDILQQMAMDLIKSQFLKLLQNVMHIPAPGSTSAGAAGAGAGGSGSGAQAPAGGIGSIITGLLKMFGLGGNNSNGAADGTGSNQNSNSIDLAGKQMSGVIKQAGQDSKDGVEGAGKANAGTLSSVGQSIVSTMLGIASVLANSNTRGGFWKGLFAAAAVGAINGAVGAIGKSSGGSGTFDGADVGEMKAAGGLINGPGTSTSDSILGIDPSTGRGTAWVSANEYVINAASAHSVGMDVLNHINSFGRLPGHAEGGPVTTTTQYVPPTTPVGGSFSADNRVNYNNIYVTVEGGTGAQQERYQTARQIARASAAHLQAAMSGN
jgi:hypothetical protein